MAIKLQGTNSVAAPGLTNDGGDGVVVGTDSVDISIGGVSKVKIDSSGRVGLGTTSVAKNDHSVLNVHSGTAGVYQYFTDSATGTGGDDGLTLGLDTSQNGMIWHRENKDIRIATNANERLRVLAGGGLTFNGDTAAANALDDYEEGDWTPTINDGGFGIGSDYSTTYTKIGNVVTLNCYIVLNSTGNGDSLEMGGFPFTVATNKYTAAVVDFGEGGYKGAYIRPNAATTNANFLQSSENPSNGRIAILGNQVGADYVIFTVSYMTS